MQTLTYFFGYILPLSFAAAWAIGPGAWWLVPAVAFVVIPVMDQALGHDTSEPDDGGPRRRWADVALWMWLPTQLACLGVVLWHAADLSPGALAGWSLAMGVISGGGGITVAHELVHRKGRGSRALAEGLMLSVVYPWFCVEHVLGHHRNVATPRDPATSRLGESVYRFWWRSVSGSLVSAWRLESERVRKRSLSGLADRRLRYAIGLVIMAGLAIAVGGPWGLAAWLVQGVVGFSLLEVINYVEHYGLQREQLANGRYERVQPHHSWNSNHALTNRLLFNLPRHADHHAWAYRTYDQLRPWPDAPTLPFGYPTMVLIALVPPLWRAVMDPRVALEAEQRAAA